MVKVYCTTTAGRSCDLFDENTKIREVFEHFGADYKVGTNSIENVRITKEGLEKTLLEWKAGDVCHLSCIVQIDNAAHMEVSGAAAILISDVSLEDWKRVEKYAPEALKLFDENGDADFKVGTRGSASGAITDHGVSFGGYSNKEGKATVTIMLDTGNEDKVAAVKELFGNTLLDLNRIEAKIPDALKDIANKEAEIGKLITEA